MRARFPFTIIGIVLAFENTAVAQSPRPEWPHRRTVTDKRKSQPIIF
jgi:hypothetical protein